MAGGCTLSVSQAGFFATLTQNQGSSLQVCSQPCTPLVDQSTVSTFKCTLPPLLSAKSLADFNITKETYLVGTPFSSKASLTSAMFDGVNQVGWNDKSAKCFFGIAFKPDYVGVLTEVKYFMNRFVRAAIVNKLVFQGSQDGVTYDNIFTIGEEIHEGWNYYTFADGKELKYRYYRFYGNDASSCMNVGEIAFRGVEVINSNEATYESCKIEVVLNNTAPVLLTGTVSY